MSDALPSTEDREQVARLERQAERERKARHEAEAIAERSLRHLYVQKEQLALLQALAAAANAAGSPEEAMREALALVCEHTGWPVGHVWRRRREGLVPTGLWCGSDEARYAGWRAATEAALFARGEGLPGRVLASGRPAWIRDVADDADFPRSAEAAAHGLHGAMAFPVLVGDEVVAVFEFFSAQPEEPDEPLLDLVAYAGVQLGHVVERQRIEGRHALILGAAGSGIFGVDADGLVTFVNAAAAERLGWAPEDLHGRPSHDAFHHHRADGAPYPYEACPLYAVLRDGREHRVTGEVFWRRDGSAFPVEYVVTPLHEGAEITGAVVVFQDVSEREELRELRETQARLAREEARYRLAARATNDAIWDWDLVSNRVGWSPAVADLFGWEEAAGGTDADWWMGRIHPDDRARVTDHIHHVIDAGGEHWQAEYRFRRADGLYAHVLDRGYTVRGPDGAPVRMVGAMQDVTERKAAEEALREEARTLEIINGINATLAGELDRQKLVQAVTDAGTELTGAAFGAFFYNVLDDRGERYTLYTLAGAPREAFERYPMPRNTAIFHPTFAGEGVVRLDDVTADPRFGKNDPYFGLPEGHLPVRSYLAVPVRSGEGEVVGGLFFGHGEAGVFTERAEHLTLALADQAAIALQNADLYGRVRDSEGRLRLATDAAQIGTWDFDPVTGRLSWDERCKAGFGLPPEAPVDYDVFLAGLHPDDRARADGAVQRALDPAGDGVYDVEYRTVWPDGSLHWVHATGQASYSDGDRGGDRRAVRFTGTVRDVTAEKEAEEALRASEAELLSIIDNLPELAWSARPDGHIDFYNRRWYEYTGTTFEEMEGWGWDKVHDPAWLPRVTERWRASIEGEEPFEMEFPLRGADGEFRWFLTRIHPLRDAEGRLTRWIGTNANIDEQKTTAAALEEARRDLAEVNQTLEERVRSRTAELSDALRALGDNEALLHSVTSNALDGIAALEAVRDDDGHIVDFRWLLVNPPAEAMYGRPASELVGALQNEVLPDVEALGLHDALVRVVETGEPFRQELAAEETGQWFSLSVSKLGDGIVALFRDISEAKAAEAALRLSERQLQEAQRLAHVGSWRWDVAADRVTWSDELYRIFGHEPGAVEVDYALYDAHLHPDDRDAVGQAVQDAMAKGEGYEMNHRIVRPDGVVRWIHSFGEVTTDEDGAVTALQGTAQDVTERVEAQGALERYAADVERAEAEVRANAGFLQSTLDSLTAHVAILDDEGRIVAVNEAWRRFARENGYRGDSLGLGESYLDACAVEHGAFPLQEDGAPSVAAGIRALLRGEIEQFTAEYPCPSPTEERWFLLRITRFESPEGTRLVTAHENVTVMKQAEAALQRYAAELEESNEELQKFAYVASHDLQEPLRMVTSFLQLLERRYAEHLDDTAREYIGYAVDGARRMQRLIQDLLAYSRVGTRAQDFAPVDAGEVVLDVLHDLGPAVDEAGAAVAAEGLPVVLADKTQLHQLLLNLVGNALKFSRPDVPPRIDITAERARLEDGRPAWRFTVADNGIGIDPQYAERIFQVFQRLHTRDEYEGTGIGLAICKKIVERHGGSVEVESALDQGALFRFTLPAPVTAAPPVTTLRAAAPRADASS